MFPGGSAGMLQQEKLKLPPTNVFTFGILDMANWGFKNLVSSLNQIKTQKTPTCLSKTSAKKLDISTENLSTRKPQGNVRAEVDLAAGQEHVAKQKLDDQVRSGKKFTNTFYIFKKT